MRGEHPQITTRLALVVYCNLLPCTNEPLLPKIGKFKREDTNYYMMVAFEHEQAEFMRP